SSSLPLQLSITFPFSNELIISGQTYELRQTAGVFPNTPAVSLIAATTFFLRAVFCSGISSLARASAHAQTSVPAQVRKSFALKFEPITSLMYSLMWRRVTRVGLLSPF